MRRKRRNHSTAFKAKVAVAALKRDRTQAEESEFKIDLTTGRESYSIIKRLTKFTMLCVELHNNGVSH
jgi:hypothetical protein